MLEFLLIAPVLLTVAGGTVEVANHMRANQIATVMSQEVANSSYRQCADIIVVQNPNNLTSIAVDTEATKRAVGGCLSNIQGTAQEKLYALLPGVRTQVHVSAFRHNVTSSTLNDSTCTGTITEIGRAAQGPDTSNPTQGSGGSQGATAISDVADNPRDYSLQVIATGSNNTAITRDGTVLVASEHACKRRNIVVSEVTVEVPRVVKFVPAFISGGKNRATTTL
jgi:Flp pilus assembly protein TadG